MRLFVNHRTEYRFTQPQRRLVQLARMIPPSFAGQAVLDWSFEVDCDARLRVGRDGYGNEIRMIYVDGPIEALVLTVTGEVLTDDRAGLVHGAPEPLPSLVYLRETPLTAPGPGIRALADDAAAAGPGTLDRMHALMQLLHARLRFDTEAMDVHRTAADALARGHGVCQDFAHLFIAAARLLDLPARYVSGHLYRRDGAILQEAAHAWAEVCVADLGWVGFDAANGICPDDAYVRVAVGHDYREAAPLAGARIGSGAEVLKVSVRVVQEQRQMQSQQSGEVE